MEEAKLFTAFYHLSELRSREDLIKGIIENIDYSMFVSSPLMIRIVYGLSVMAIHELSYRKRSRPATRYAVFVFAVSMNHVSSFST